MCGISNDRNLTVVRGVLVFHWVAVLDYVQVMVETAEALADVKPSSLRLLERRSAVGPTSPGPADLADARRKGVLPQEWDQPGGTWTEMDNQLDVLVAPLRESGWRAISRQSEASWEHGDSVSVDLARDGVTIELELFGDGWLTGYPVGDDDGEPSEAFWSFDAKVPGVATDRFRAMGWV